MGADKAVSVRLWFFCWMLELERIVEKGRWMRGGGSKGTLEPLSVHWSPGWTKIQEMACCLSL